MNSIKQKNVIDLSVAGYKTKIQPITQRVIRVAMTKKPEISSQSLLVEDVNYDTQDILCMEETADCIKIFTSQVSLWINSQTGEMLWKDAHGKELLSEGAKTLLEIPVIKYVADGGLPCAEMVKTVDGEHSSAANLHPIQDRIGYRGELVFHFDEDEAIYGLGQGEDGIYDYRGHTQYLYQHNMRIPIPFLISSRGYGLFFDCCSLMSFKDSSKDATMTLNAIDQIDYYFIYGENFDEIIDGLRTLTGQAVMLPKWAFGYIQSKECYECQDEMVAVGEEYRKRGIPIDCLVQDWRTWEEGKWGNKIVDKKRFYDIKAMNQHLHQLNIHTMVSIWPDVGIGCENHTELSRAGKLLGDYSVYDAFDEEARKIYWNQIEQELYPGGYDGWWCDCSEPFSSPDWCGSYKKEPEERFNLVGSEHEKYLDPMQANAFSLVHAQGIYENQRHVNPRRRVLNLTRSGYPSIQKYGVVLWSGDISARWDVLRKQITEGLNMALSGIPYWTLDIGGFFTVGEVWQNRGCGCNGNEAPLWFWNGEYDMGVADLGYRELYVRWLQYGVFLPMFRSHGTDTPREIWQFGEKGEPFYDSIEKGIVLRYSLMPYIYSLAGMTTLRSYTMLRSLMFDFADDPAVRHMDTEFMFGPSLLICPVTKPMYYDKNSTPLHGKQVQSCYLPKGADWFDFWTGKQYSGGQTVVVPAPIDIIPVFVKSGSILPMAQGLEYASQRIDVTKIVIYGGANAKFDLYTDDGESYDYEKGAYSLIPLSWEEESGYVTLGSRSGNYHQAKDCEEFQITYGQQQKSVIYYGQEISIQFEK